MNRWVACPYASIPLVPLTPSGALRSVPREGGYPPKTGVGRGGVDFIDFGIAMRRPNKNLAGKGIFKYSDWYCTAPALKKEKSAKRHASGDPLAFLVRPSII